VEASGFQYGGGTGPGGSFSLSTALDFFNEELHAFTVGDFLRFRLALNIVQPGPGGFPDQVSLYLLDDALQPLPTDDAASAFAIIDLDGDAPVPQVFGSTEGGVPAPVSEPVVVPEPSAMSFGISGIGVLLLVARRIARKQT
jgi:hypothetical protein